MPTKRTSSSSRASKPASKPAPKPASKTSRPAPTKTIRTAVAPHIKTLSDGSPRPKRRSK